ncbi:MAG: hypothetical protein GXP16_01500 [Gammaproteobacteria bacterium]|nr:hypothetical protein [Gammaproteobacteria bacterium]
MNKATDNLPMKDVDADDPEVKRLLDAGWDHRGNDKWAHTKSTLRYPVRRDTALRIEDALS